MLKEAPSLQENGKSHEHGNFLSDRNSVDEKNERLQQAILRRQALLDQLKVSYTMLRLKLLQISYL